MHLWVCAAGAGRQCAPAALVWRWFPLLLMYAASCGGGVVLLLVIATGRIAYRGERGSIAA
jgi:hypothetical protein